MFKKNLNRPTSLLLGLHSQAGALYLSPNGLLAKPCTPIRLPIYIWVKMISFKTAI